MESVSLNIKNMVCPRCIAAVENMMKELGVQIQSIELGHVMVQLPKTILLNMIKLKLDSLGLELIQEKDDLYVEKIKILIIEYLRLLEEAKELHILSDFISKRIGKNYNYLTKVFSQYCNLTIEQYYIKQRLQRVKQLLDEDELNVTEISYRLCYSSVNYLSAQFKKYVGMSITDYRIQLHEMKGVFKEVSHCINDLKQQGFDLNFTMKEDKYFCREKREFFGRLEVNVFEKYNHSFDGDHSGHARVSIIETTSDLRGILVEIPDHNRNHSKVI